VLEHASTVPSPTAAGARGVYCRRPRPGGAPGSVAYTRAWCWPSAPTPTTPTRTPPTRAGAPISQAGTERAHRMSARGPGLAADAELGALRVRVGVVGVGALGQHHAARVRDAAGARLAGVYDIDPSRSAAVVGRHGGRVFEHLRDLLDEVDAVSVAVPTVDHHRVARFLLERPARTSWSRSP